MTHDKALKLGMFLVAICCITMGFSLDTSQNFGPFYLDYLKILGIATIAGALCYIALRLLPGGESSSER